MQEAQKSTATSANRYVPIFEDGRAALNFVRGDKKRRKVLSFGCSTGEEIESLRSMFPDDDLYGCDIKPELIEQLTSSKRGNATYFFSSDENLKKHGPFDFITCMSVLCVHPAIKVRDTYRGLDYALFDRLFRSIVSATAEHGVLCLYNFNHPVGMHPLAKNLTAVRSPRLCHSGFVDLFSPDGTRIARGQYGTPLSGRGISLPVRYVRDISPFSSIYDFTDCVFVKNFVTPTLLLPMQKVEERSMGHFLGEARIEPVLYGESGEVPLYPIIRSRIEGFGASGGTIVRSASFLDDRGREVELGSYEEVLSDGEFKMLGSLLRGY